MTDSMVAKTCVAFSDELAAKTSVPGGGGAAALVGALAAALCSMAGNFTVGKKKYAIYEDDVRRMLDEGEQIRVRLLELVDEDAEAFRPVAAAYAIPKEDPARAETIEIALKGAITAPLETMRQVAAAIELIEEMNVKASRLLVTDVGCAAVLASAAMQAAAMNVFINTGSLSDAEFVTQVEQECDGLLAYAARAEMVASEVMRGIRNHSEA